MTYGSMKSWKDTLSKVIFNKFSKSFKRRRQMEQEREEIIISV